MSNTTQFTIAISHALSAAAAAHLDTEVQVLPISTPADQDLVSSPKESLSVVIRFAQGLDGLAYICPDQDASRSLFPTKDVTDSTEISSAWLDFLGAYVEGTVDALRSEFGEVECDHCALVDIPEQFESVGGLRLSGGERIQGTVWLWGSPTLLASLHRSRRNSNEGEAHSLSRDAEEEAGASFERVIDVPLGVTLRFGQRQMPLRELLDLNMGSLVELDRQVDEPVDLMLGERLIARGEVVIVDGNYGMRVTEVIEQPTRKFAEVG